LIVCRNGGLKSMFNIWLIFSKCRLSLAAFFRFFQALLDAGLRYCPLSLLDAELWRLLDLSELDLLRRFCVWCGGEFSLCC